MCRSHQQADEQLVHLLEISQPREVKTSQIHQAATSAVSYFLNETKTETESNITMTRLGI